MDAQAAPPIDPAEGAFHDDLERLRHVLAEREDLLALVSHELRNPLHGLSLQLALLRALADTQGTPDLIERIRKVQSGFSRYTERVTVLMELLISPTHEYPLNAMELDVDALLRSFVDSLEHEARSRGFQLIYHGSGPCIAHCDRVALEQVVDNLLLNAFKHSGGDVVTLKLQRVDGEARISITDNGRGIAPDDQARIFQKYGVATVTPRGTGSGLGLWIVRRLVATVGGRIELRSAPGAGTTFEVAFALDLTTGTPS